MSCVSSGPAVTEATKRGGRKKIDRDTLKSMVRREQELRTCEETQQKYSEAERQETTDWMEVTIALQEQVIREFQIEDIAWGLYQLRRACDQYPDDADFINIPLYHKYQRSRQGSLREGDACPDMPLHHLNKEMVSLLSLVRPGRPLCIFAGSYT